MSKSDPDELDVAGVDTCLGCSPAPAPSTSPSRARSTPPPSATTTSPAPMSALCALPFDVFLALAGAMHDNDVLALSVTCRAMWAYANEYWRTRLSTCPPHLLEAPPHSHSRLYFGLKFPHVFSWGPHDEHLLDDAAADTPTAAFTGAVVDVVRPVDVTSRFVRHPPLVRLWDVGTRLVAMDAARGLWEWDRGRSVPGRPSRVWLKSRVEDVATGPSSYAVLDTDGRVWAMERQGVGQRLIAIPPAQQIAVGIRFMAALCDGDIWVWFTERTPVGELDPNRDERVPAKLKPPPRRAEWRGWTVNRVGRKSHRDDFESQWASRGGGAGCDDGERIVHIACGWDEMLVLKADGEVWLGDAHGRSWDFLPHFSRPDNHNIAMRASTFAVFSSDPWPVLGTHSGHGCTSHPPHAIWPGARPTDRITQLAIGGDHCVALSVAGKVYSWGSAERCLLGRAEVGTDVAAARVLFRDDLIRDDDEPFVVDVAGSAVLALGDGCPPRRRHSGASTGTATPRRGAAPLPRRGLRERLVKMLW